MRKTRKEGVVKSKAIRVPRFTNSVKMNKLSCYSPMAIAEVGSDPRLTWVDPLVPSVDVLSSPAAFARPRAELPSA